MNMKLIIGNVTLLALFMLSFVFNYSVLKKDIGQLPEAGVMSLVFLLFYFVGKSISFNNLQKYKDSQLKDTFINFFAITGAISIPVFMNIEHIQLGQDIYALILCLAVCIIGLDLFKHIDIALEGQVYKEMPKGSDYFPIMLVIYLVTALIVIFFYPGLT